MDQAKRVHQLNVLFDNVNFASDSGPNNFSKKLAHKLKELGYNILMNGDTSKTPDVQLSFISNIENRAPIVLRLDGLYFNTEQPWKLLNDPIRRSYELASAIVFQSEFNKKLVEKYIGDHDNCHIIHNGTNLDWIEEIPPIDSPVLDGFSGVWCCASTWRPHKRLSENIRYFLEHAPDDCCFVVAGDTTEEQHEDPRIFYAGKLDWVSLVGLFKRSETFVHLAWLDHCPNVVVDARASGCHIVCSSTGGTSEIAGKNATIISEDEWDLEPVKLYEPPALDFSRKLENDNDSGLSINQVTEKYIEVFRSVI